LRARPEKTVFIRLLRTIRSVFGSVIFLSKKGGCMNNMVSQDQIVAMSAEELWELYNQLGGVLKQKLRLQMKEIDGLLTTLLNASEPLQEPPNAVNVVTSKSRRPYPRPAPQFRNPDDPSQTWAGRGLRPRWLNAQIQAGRNIDEFRIGATARPKRKLGQGSLS
jgi:DNA-binding protein H-NS